MIYFDNAATTMRKPECVVDAVSKALETFGGAGRGVHPASLAASEAVHRARRSVADLLGAPSTESVGFGSNATMALNIAINALLPDGGVAVTTAASHNSVLRPLFRARDERGCTIRIVPVDSEGHLDYSELEEAAEGADLFALTHASNLTGEVYDVERYSAIAHGAGSTLLVDAAQTAGSIPIDMQEQGIDVLCFTGHKSLYGPQGTGGICVSEEVVIVPLLEGGTGTHSFDERQPGFMPESVEAGTLNAQGIAGLGASVDWLLERGVDNIHERNMQLFDRFVSGAREIPAIRIYGMRDDAFGDPCMGAHSQCPTLAFNLGDADSGYVVDQLAEGWDICARGGFHCAPLMHRALGTAEQGAVRFAFSAFNDEGEIDASLDALAELAQEL